MASPGVVEARFGTPKPRPGRLLTRELLWLVWLPVVVISVLHYATSPHHGWAHDVLRRLYYVPILFAAFSRGLRGGLTAALVSSASYAPHAFMVHPGVADPATGVNKLLEIVLYNTIGILAGVLADREAARRAQAEHACAQQRNMAEQLVRAGRLAALGELVAGIAHELKNPLHTLKGTAEILDEIVPRNAEESGMWVLLKEEIERLDRTADRFLSFARPTEPQLEATRFIEIFERIEELLRVQVRSSRQIAFDVVAVPEAMAQTVVRADRDQLAQVALNLGSNAVRAMKGKGRLELAVSSREGDAGRFFGVRLENDGPVIPDEVVERIFDPFFSRSDSGTGLGLAIAERIAEGHGGFLEVRNTGSERGVAFTLWLPASS